MSTVVLASILAPMTRVLFAIHDQADPQAVPNGHDSKKEKRRRMRMRVKGTEDPDAEFTYNFYHFRAAARSALTHFWTALKLGLLLTAKVIDSFVIHSYHISFNLASGNISIW